MFWVIPLAIIGVLFVGGLAVACILDWFDDNTISSSKYGELIKKRLSNGDYRIIAGVFDKRGHQTATQEWQTTELDTDLKEYFGRRNRVRIKLET